MTTSEIIRKRLPLQADAIRDNTLTGIASVAGVIDRAGDIILPGAWKSALDGFTSAGFVTVGHDWGGLPVAMPSDIRERGRDLIISATFHSTEEAQAVRAVCQERLEHGLDVGLSVGFTPDYDAIQTFSSGKAFLASDLAKSVPEGLLDTQGIARWRDRLRVIPTVLSLYEVSIVSVPANALARVTAVKADTEPIEEAAQEPIETWSIDRSQIAEYKADDAAGEREPPSVRTIERALRDAGLSRSAAKRIAGLCIKQRDAADRTDADEAHAQPQPDDNDIDDADRDARRRVLLMRSRALTAGGLRA